MQLTTLRELPPPPANKTGWPWTEECPPFPELMPDGTVWPRISIVTPSYNQADFLEATIRSILLQRYPNLEYMVIDGGSQDDSISIIRKYEPWLAYWVSEPDRGQSHAINKGWERVSGELVAYLNSDDFYYPSAIGKVAEVWKKDPTVAVIAGGIAAVDETGCKLNEKRPFLRGASPLDLSLLDPSDWFLPQQSLFFVREHMDSVGRRLKEELHYTMDRELMYRICQRGKILLVDDTLAGDRHHSQSKRLSQTIRMYAEDGAALALCDWGGPQAVRQRKQVARARLAQGHYYYSKRVPSRLSSFAHFSLAAFYRPSYLLQGKFARTIVSALRRALK